MRLKELVDATLDGSNRPVNSDRATVRTIVNQVYLEVVAKLRLNVQTFDTAAPDETGAFSLEALCGGPVLALRHLLLPHLTTGQLAQVTEAAESEVLTSQFDQLFYLSAPSYAILEPDTLIIAPIPSTGLRMILAACLRPDRLVSDQDEPSAIPEEFHDLIVVGSISRAIRTQNPTVSAQLAVSFQAGLEEMRRWRNSRRGASSMQIRPQVGTVRSARVPGVDYGA